MTFGVGMALQEEAIVDVRSGAFVNCDLGEYLVPVPADIPAIDAVTLDGFDDKANALGIKGGDTPLLWALRDVLGMTVPSSAAAWRCAGQYWEVIVQSGFVVSEETDPNSSSA
jgi:hypothetical protein